MNTSEGRGYRVRPVSNGSVGTMPDRIVKISSWDSAESKQKENTRISRQSSTKSLHEHLYQNYPTSHQSNHMYIDGHSLNQPNHPQLSSRQFSFSKNFELQSSKQTLETLNNFQQLPPQYRSLDRKAKPAILKREGAPSYDQLLRREEEINQLRREKSEVIRQAVKRSTLPLQLTTVTNL